MYKTEYRHKREDNKQAMYISIVCERCKITFFNGCYIIKYQLSGGVQALPNYV